MNTLNITTWSLIQPSSLGMGTSPLCGFSERREYHDPISPSVTEEEILR